MPERRRGATTEYILVFDGKFTKDTVKQAEALLEHLRRLSGDARLTLVRVEDGSVRIVLRGTRAGFEQLQASATTGELAEMVGMDLLGIEWAEAFEPSAEADEEALIERARSGDREAWEQLLNDLYPTISHMARSVMHHGRYGWVEAEDLAAEALMSLMPDRLPEWAKSLNDLRRFSYMVLRRKAMDYMRREQRDRAARAEVPMIDVAKAEEGDLLESLAGMEAYRRLDAVLSQLSSRERAVLRAFYFENMSLSKVSEELQISRPAVHRLLRRAVERVSSQVREKTD